MTIVQYGVQMKRVAMAIGAGLAALFAAMLLFAPSAGATYYNYDNYDKHDNNNWNNWNHKHQNKKWQNNNWQYHASWHWKYVDGHWCKVWY